jgi:hypothetical protein
VDKEHQKKEQFYQLYSHFRVFFHIQLVDYFVDTPDSGYFEKTKKFKDPGLTEPLEGKDTEQVLCESAFEVGFSDLCWLGDLFS